MILRKLIQPRIINEEINIEVTKDGKLLTTLKQSFGALELGVALLTAILDPLQWPLLWHIVSEMFDLN